MLEQIEKGYASQIKYGYGVSEFFETKEYKSAKDELTVQQNVVRAITNLVSTFSDTFSSALVIKENGEAFGYPTYEKYAEMNLNKTGWYGASVKSGKNMWVGNHSEGLSKDKDSEYVLSFLSPYVLSGENKVGGVIVLDIKSTAFAKMLGSVHVGKNSLSYIVTPSNKVINRNGELDSTVSVDKNGVLRDVMNYAKSKNSFVFMQKMNGINYIASYCKSTTTGWIFVTAVPESEITSATKSIRYQVALLAVICVILAVLIGARMSFTITSSVKKLMKIMGQAAQGDLGVKISLNRKDEIGALASNFNSMLEQIHSLVSQSKKLADEVSISSQNITKISSRTNTISSEVTATIQEIANGISNQACEMEKSLTALSKLTDGISEVVKSVELIKTVSEDVRTITDTGIQTAGSLNLKAAETNRITTTVVENISRLNTLVQNINEITGLLKNMAEQTK